MGAGAGLIGVEVGGLEVAAEAEGPGLRLSKLMALLLFLPAMIEGWRPGRSWQAVGRHGARGEGLVDIDGVERSVHFEAIVPAVHGDGVVVDGVAGAHDEGAFAFQGPIGEAEVGADVAPVVVDHVVRQPRLIRRLVGDADALGGGDVLPRDGAEVVEGVHVAAQDDGAGFAVVGGEDVVLLSGDGIEVPAEAEVQREALRDLEVVLEVAGELVAPHVVLPLTTRYS